MFRQKMFKAGIAAGSFIFMAAAPGNKTVTAFDNTSHSCLIDEPDSLIKDGHAFDSTGLCTCLPDLSITQLSAAPRIELNRQVAGFVNNYIHANDFYLDKIKVKSTPFFTVIDTILFQYNLPVELKYLAVIESKLDNRIVSGAGAAGIWQLMPSAARSFGLKVNGKNDERRNIYKSTAAAAKCLVYLHNIFDDWLLTLAAYNSGPARVLSAIKKSGSRNFWTLQKYLPAETREHVKKFIAIHYYFEGHGSLATLTKAETKAHIDDVAEFVKKQELQETDTLPAEENITKLTVR